MNFPVVQIQQQYAKIGFDADLGKYSIKQPRPDLQIETKPAQLETRYVRGEQNIDQSQSWKALGKGKPFQFSARIASEAQRIVLEGIARVAGEGDQMTHIHTGEDAIASIAWGSVFRVFKVNYEGPFSTSSYNINYMPNRPESQFTPGSVEVKTRVNRPQIQYERGKLEYFMQQHASIEFIPPKLDLKV
jgi:hypothetical protein